jgi:DNA-directed RNA polymerase specialized sigma subunit
VLEDAMPSDPVDEYFEEKEKSAADRVTEDMRVFGQWKDKPNKRNLSHLLRRFEPEINKRVNMWKAKAVPQAAFKADLKKNAIAAFENYDPNRGAQLRTHVNNMMRRSQRFNARYQNVAFIPEEKSALISPINKAKDHLHDELGQMPTNRQIASWLNRNQELVPKRVQGRVTSKLVKTVEKYQIKDIPGGKFETDPTANVISFERETLSMLRSALKGDEITVYDYMFGQGGKPKVESTGQIAVRMGKSPSQISRLRKRVEATYKKYT